MSPIDYYKNAFTENYVNFSGRARRSEFWYFILFNMIAAIAMMIVDYMIGMTILYPLYILGAFLPGLAVAVRRLHDTDRSGWWYLIGLIPLIGTIILIVFWAQDSTPGMNMYGPNPKNPQEMEIEDHLV